MSTKRNSSTKPPSPSAKKPGTGTATPPAIDPGEAAYQRLHPRIDSFAAERLGPPRADVRTAASFVLSDTVPRLKDPGLQARLATLPKSEFDHSAVADLEAAAMAALWAQAQLAEADAAQSTARLDVTLVQEATQLRGLMLDVCSYHFRDDGALLRQLEDIRSGQGYLDLAEDLRRLAGLYRSQHERLKHDLRFFHTEDADAALLLSQRIHSELRTTTPQAARLRTWQTWALLVELYSEVARGAHFLLREAGLTAFPLLHSTGRTTPRRAKTPGPTGPSTPPGPA